MNNPGYPGFECCGPFDVDQLRTSVDWVRQQGDADVD
jgi:hypothetical protein